MASVKLAQLFCLVVLVYPAMSWPIPRFLWGGASLQTVPELDVNLYLGRWYQVYTDLVVYATFERNAYCVTADYGLNPNGTISVYNAARLYSPRGPTNDIRGFASVNPDEPGKLAVQFPYNPAPGDYWVIALGPVENNQYQYAVVTDSWKLTLFVLARDPVKFGREYQAEVLLFLEEQNFTWFWNRPLTSYQGADCFYPQ